MLYHLDDCEFYCIEQGLTHIPSSLQDASFSREKIRKMDLSFNAISSLEGLEHFTNLDTLILDNNELTDDQFILPPCPNLVYLSLNKNKLRDLDFLLTTISQSAPSLKYLCLLGNPACPHPLSGPEFDLYDHDRYRIYVAYRLPQLLWLDSSFIKPAERQEALQRGQFLRVVRVDLHTDEKMKEEEKHSFDALPSAKDLSSHAGMFGVVRYRYSGKNSEGNRFIRNNDL